MQKKTKEYQLDIFGNWKSVDLVSKEVKLAKRYRSKEFTSNKNYLKNGGVFYVNKAFVKTD